MLNAFLAVICDKSRIYLRLPAALLRGDKPNGAEARSSEELKFLSSQATLSYRVAVATDALIPRRRWHETKFAGRKGKATLAVSGLWGYWLWGYFLINFTMQSIQTGAPEIVSTNTLAGCISSK